MLCVGLRIAKAGHSLRLAFSVSPGLYLYVHQTIVILGIANASLWV